VTGKAGSLILGAGRMNLVGEVPNGQSFRANPKRTWVIKSRWVTVCGQDLGKIGPLAEQVRLGNFWIPQRGLFFNGSSYLDSFDIARQVSVISRGSVSNDRCMGCKSLPEAGRYRRLSWFFRKLQLHSAKLSCAMATTLNRISESTIIPNLSIFFLASSLQKAYRPSPLRQLL